MMKKKLLPLLLAAALLLTGCQLAQNGQGNRNFIGILVTDQAYGQDTILYAHLEENRYVFDQGYTLLVPRYTNGVEDLSGTYDEVFTLNQTDTQHISATMYTEAGEQTQWFVHPVYQGEDGTIFAQCSIQGFMVTDGSQQGYQYSWSRTEANFSLTLDFQVSYPVTQYRLWYMDADYAVLNQEIYAAGQLPQELSLHTTCDALIIETVKAAPNGSEVKEAALYTRFQSHSALAAIPVADHCQTLQYVELRWQE